MKSLFRRCKSSAGATLAATAPTTTTLSLFAVGVVVPQYHHQQIQRRYMAAAEAPVSSSHTPPPTSPSPTSAAASMYKSNRGRTRGLPPSNKAASPQTATTTATSTASNVTANTNISAARSTPQRADTESAAAMAGSCSDERPAEERPLSALQRRQLAMKDKKVFTLTGRAVDRVNLLLALHNDRVADRLRSTTASSTTSSATNTDLQRAVGIRIGVKKKGCSGYSYTVNYEFDEEKLKLKTGGDALVDAMINSTRPPSAAAAASPTGGKISLSGAFSSSAPANRHPSDVHVDQDGVHIFVEGSALFYVIGTVMDYSVSNVEEKFTFQNPNQAHSCGCGESFMPFGV